MRTILLSPWINAEPSIYDGRVIAYRKTLCKPMIKIDGCSMRFVGWYIYYHDGIYSDGIYHNRTFPPDAIYSVDLDDVKNRIDIRIQTGPHLMGDEYVILETITDDRYQRLILLE